MAIAITSTKPEVNKLFEKFLLSIKPKIFIKKEHINNITLIIKMKFLNFIFLEIPKNIDIIIPKINKTKVPYGFIKDVIFFIKSNLFFSHPFF